jgi:hypothetical protein
VANSLPNLIAARKTLAVVPEWSPHEDRFRFVVGLDIDGVTQEGLWLRGQCNREIPDCRVSFQIDCLFPGFRRGPAVSTGGRSGRT